MGAGGLVRLGTLPVVRGDSRAGGEGDKIDVVLRFGQGEMSLPLAARRRGEFNRFDFDAVGVEGEAIGARPGRGLDDDVDFDWAGGGGKIAGVKFVIDG